MDLLESLRLSMMSKDELMQEVSARIAKDPSYFDAAMKTILQSFDAYLAARAKERDSLAHDALNDIVSQIYHAKHFGKYINGETIYWWHAVVRYLLPDGFNSSYNKCTDTLLETFCNAYFYAPGQPYKSDWENEQGLSSYMDKLHEQWLVRG